MQYHEFLPNQAVSNGWSTLAPLDNASGTSFPVEFLAFDDDADNQAFFVFRPLENISNGIKVNIDWYTPTTSSGNVVWGCQLAAITPNADNISILSKPMDTAQAVVAANLGSLGNRLQRTNIHLSNINSGVANDWCCLNVYRDANHGSDSLSGNANVTLVTIAYSG